MRRGWIEEEDRISRTSGGRMLLRCSSVRSRTVLQPSVVDLRVVLDPYPAVSLVLVEDLLRVAQHIFGAGLSFGWHVGDREEPSLYAVEVEDLLVVEGSLLEGSGA